MKFSGGRLAIKNGSSVNIMAANTKTGWIIFDKLSCLILRRRVFFLGKQDWLVIYRGKFIPFYNGYITVIQRLYIYVYIYIYIYDFVNKIFNGVSNKDYFIRYKIGMHNNKNKDVSIHKQTIALNEMLVCINKS